MNKINLVLTLFFIAILQVDADAATRKILFIGNSYTAVNDLPSALKNLALSLGDTLEVDSHTPGGMTFNGHTTDATTLAKIAIGGWDYVVLQAQSQEPSFDPVQVAADTYPYAKRLDSLIHVSNPCAETIFYMTWGRKNGDASNCAFYPPVCTYAGMQQRLRESYLEMSLNNNATCAPVGVVWKNVRNLYPGIELYNADESHPSVQGTYLIACTFYSSMYHKSSVGSSFLMTGVSTSEALSIQQVASTTVLDSLENWQAHGSLPKAKFSFSNSLNQFSFNNQSLRSTQYEWNFGDGSAVNTQSNPTHIYASTGQYAVTLKAKQACGKYDIFTDSVDVIAIANTVGEVHPNSLFQLTYTNGFLTVHNHREADRLKIYSILGNLIGEFPLTKSLQTISFSSVTPGMYFYSVFTNKKLVLQDRFQVN